MSKTIPTEILPIESIPSQRMDKKQWVEFLTRIAREDPNKYVKLMERLTPLLSNIAAMENVGSFNLDHLEPSEEARKIRREALKKIESYLSIPDDKERERRITEYLVELSETLKDKVYEEALQKSNPLAFQVASGARGNKYQLKRLIGGDTVYIGHKGDPIPIPVLNSYSEGVSPAEFWAATYGARKGLAETKLGIADTGYLLKLFVRATHRLVVTGEDSPIVPDVPIGYPVDIDDVDNEGALLAVDTGPYKRNTVLTPAILEDLKNRKYKRILIRSPICSLAPSGIYSKDVGLREDGQLPPIGSIPGITAAQAIGERLTQTSLSSKHLGGMTDKRESGFSVIERIVNVPKHFKGGAIHATLDGKITKIRTNEIGQTLVYINEVPHIIDPGFNPIVKVGDIVEAGDPLSDGIPNPAMIVAFKGIGEGRRQFVDQFVKEMIRAGQPVHRRNVELLARGLIDHVEITERFQDYLPGDIVPYSTIAVSWKPRKDALTIPVDSAMNYYLEKPILHYTIGTRITKSVINTLKEFGIKEVVVHKDPPPFNPVMIRATAILEFDPNWLTRLFGANQLRILLNAVRRGSEAPIYDSSFVPAKVMGIPLSRWKEEVQHASPKTQGQ